MDVYKRISRKVRRPQPFCWVINSTNIDHRHHSTAFQDPSSVTDGHLSLDSYPVIGMPTVPVALCEEDNWQSCPLSYSTRGRSSASSALSVDRRIRIALDQVTRKTDAQVLRSENSASLSSDARRTLTLEKVFVGRGRSSQQEDRGDRKSSDPLSGLHHWEWARGLARTALAVATVGRIGRVQYRMALGGANWVSTHGPSIRSSYRSAVSPSYIHSKDLIQLSTCGFCIPSEVLYEWRGRMSCADGLKRSRWTSATCQVTQHGDGNERFALGGRTRVMKGVRLVAPIRGRVSSKQARTRLREEELN